MNQPATNRQRKLLKFFEVSFGPDITLGAASWEIDGILSDSSNREQWRRYVYLTHDLDSDTDDLRSFDETELGAVEVPKGWETEAAVQEFREELAQHVIAEEGPFDSPAPTITFEDMTFCFTGKFDTGSRSDCENVVRERGGKTTSTVSSDVTYLVVGALGSPIWKRGSYGRKIERAINLRRETGQPAIVSECDWKQSL